MKKKLKIFILGVSIIGLAAFAILFKFGRASAADVTVTGKLSYGTSIYYGHASKQAFTRRFAITGTEVTNDLGGPNTFCLNPKQTPPAKNSTQVGHREWNGIVFEERDYNYLLYFIYNGPGWADNKEKIKELFVSNHVMTEAEVENDNLLYAYSHALMAWQYQGGAHGGAAAGLTSEQQTGLTAMLDYLKNRDNYTQDKSNPDNKLIIDYKKLNNLHVYHVDNGNNQNMIFWTYETPKVYIDIVKEYDPGDADDGNDRVFKLYKANNGKCEDLHDADHLVASTNDPNTGYRGTGSTYGNHYFLGLKKTGSGSNVEYEALLDPKGKYCIWEKPAKKDGVYYEVNYSVTTTDDTANPSTVCPPFASGETTGPCTYGVINLGTTSGYKYDKVVDVYYKRVNVTNELEAEGCISITKKDGTTGDKLSGVPFNLYSNNSCTGTPDDTKNTNSSGVAKFTGLNANTQYYVKEAWDSTSYNPDSACTPVKTNSDSTCKKITKTNNPYYISFYKEDEKGQPLSDIRFKVKADGSDKYIRVYANPDPDYHGCYVYRDETTSGSILKTDENGRICIVQIPKTNNSTSYTAYERKTLDGYVFNNGTITGIKPLTEIRGKTCTENDCNKLINKPLVLNFYKVLEDGATPKGGAEFVLSYVDANDNTQYIKVKNERDTTKPNKGCYIYDDETTDKTAASRLVSSTTNQTDGVNIGEVCIVQIPSGKYTATETKPLDYHTFGEDVTKEITITDTSSTRVELSSAKKFPNYKTEFEFTKTVSEENGYDSIWKNMSTAELKTIPFTIYDSQNNKVSVIKTSDGVYEYAGNNIDGASGTATTTLTLGDNRKFKVYHLPKGTYRVEEDECCCETTCTSPSSNNCYGFYSPKGGTNSYKFTINECSTSHSAGTDETGASVCPNGTSIATETMDNSPTEVDFTKSDFYSYVNPSDTVQFENDEERSAFDEITFKVFYRGANNEKIYVNFAKVGNIGTCATDASYSEYRYIPEGTDSSLISGLTLTQELHTCGGHIHLTHLCRGRTYYIEEVAVSGKSVFTLPEREEDRIKEIDLECCKEDTTKPSTTAIINDKPTRVIFEKRDAKYGYLIDDPETTFELYRCAEGAECHPGDYTSAEERTAAGITLVKFNPRAVIPNDQEDPDTEVYRAVTNVNNASGSVTDLHPYYGKLILRYLESGFNYVLLETKAPQGYSLPKGRNAETGFTVVTNTVQVDEVDVPNTPTSLLIRKYDDEGNLLEGAEFKIYEGTTCDKNISPKAQPKQLLRLKTIRDGVYDNREVRDTDTMITCTDKEGSKCSDIDTNLTLNTYVNTWANFDNRTNQNKDTVEMQAGEILVQYLEYGHCYIIEEVKAPKGYSLPENEDDRFVMVTIEQDDEIVDTLKQLVNKPTPFTFYKYDDHNNLIDGGEYKLQKLNQNKKYVDVTVTEEEKDGKLYYKVDKNSTNKTIRTINGSATVYYLEEGQYRIVETKAPEGMELPKKEINVAVFYVSDDGSVVGNGIIANKPKTEKIVVKPSASAEFIVAISTGMEKIKYGLIFIGIVLILGVLIIVRYKPNIFKNKVKK